VLTTIASRGIQLFSEKVGSGPPLVTLHGGLGLDHTYLRPWLDPLGDTFEIHYLDQRGCGRSTPRGELEGVTHATWVDDVDAFRAELGHEKIFLFGHSYGAFLALEYALRHGDRLAGLILSSVAPVIDYPQVIMQNARDRATPEQFELVASTFGRPASDDAALERLWKAVLPLYFQRFDAEKAEAVNARMKFHADAFNQSTAQCLPTFNVVERLPEIRTPTLILAGRHDWILPVHEAAERTHAGIAGSTLVVFEESGHFPFIEEQSAYTAAVRAWKARI
jgi:proline iminopeptidase